MLIPSPIWLEAGAAWQLTAAIFIGLRGVSGFADLCRGFAGRKRAVNFAAAAPPGRQFPSNHLRSAPLDHRMKPVSACFHGWGRSAAADNGLAHA
jgi:hypothetical protein